MGGIGQTAAVLEGKAMSLILPSNSTTMTYQQIQHLSRLWREGQANCQVLILDYTKEDINVMVRYSIEVVPLQHYIIHYYFSTYVQYCCTVCTQ